MGLKSKSKEEIVKLNETRSNNIMSTKVTLFIQKYKLKIKEWNILCIYIYMQYTNANSNHKKSGAAG